MLNGDKTISDIVKSPIVVTEELNFKITPYFAAYQNSYGNLCWMNLAVPLVLLPWKTFWKNGVGEIWDEHDDEDFKQQSDGSFLISM